MENKEQNRSIQESKYKLGDIFRARIEDSEALLFDRKKGRQLSRLLVSDAVPLEDNKNLVITIGNRYVDYLKGGKEAMEIRTGKLVDVKLENGVASLYDKRSFQPIAYLRYNTHVSPLETMAFISAVVDDYEKYMRLINKYFNG